MLPIVLIEDYAFLGTRKCLGSGHVGAESVRTVPFGSNRLEQLPEAS
jgi:hypothetical protein